jgi:hypothetical protein
MLLDLVEVAESHTGANLGSAFANVLQMFGIEDKVSQIDKVSQTSLTSVAHIADSWDHW